MLTIDVHGIDGPYARASTDTRAAASPRTSMAHDSKQKHAVLVEVCPLPAGDELCAGVRGVDHVPHTDAVVIAQTARLPGSTPRRGSSSTDPGAFEGPPFFRPEAPTTPSPCQPAREARVRSWLKLDEKVDVAIRALLPFENGSEQGEPRDVMPGAERFQRRAVDVKSLLHALAL
jgi:hypothetical protein